MSAVTTNLIAIPSTIVEIDPGYELIHTLLATKGLNNIFPAFGILNFIDEIDLVEYNREYIGTVKGLPIILKFIPCVDSWKWRTIIGDKAYNCMLREERYRELLDRIHTRLGI